MSEASQAVTTVDSAHQSPVDYRVFPELQQLTPDQIVALYQEENPTAATLTTKEGFRTKKIPLLQAVREHPLRTVDGYSSGELINASGQLSFQGWVLSKAGASKEMLQNLYDRSDQTRYLADVAMSEVLRIPLVQAVFIRLANEVRWGGMPERPVADSLLHPERLIPTAPQLFQFGKTVMAMTTTQWQILSRLCRTEDSDFSQAWDEYKFYMINMLQRPGAIFVAEVFKDVGDAAQSQSLVRNPMGRGRFGTHTNFNAIEHAAVELHLGELKDSALQNPLFLERLQQTLHPNPKGVSTEDSTHL